MAKIAIPQNSVATNNIQNQADIVIGDAENLKKAFDQYGIDEKTYNNTVLIPALNGDTGANMIGFNSPNLNADNSGDAIEELFQITQTAIPFEEVENARTSSVYGAFVSLKERVDNADVLLSEIFISVNGKNTSEIQNLINSEHLNGIIHFPNNATNLYVLTDTLFIPSDTKIIISKNVTLKLADSINKPIFKNLDPINGNENITIIGGKFDMNVNNQTIKTPCIRFDKLNNSYFENLEILGTKIATYVGEGAWHFQDCNNNVIFNCILKNSGDEGLMIIGVDNKILGGEYSECSQGSGIQGSGNNLFIDGSILKNCNGSSIAVHGKNVKVTNNTIIGGGSDGTSGITLGHTGNPCYDSVISGNTIFNKTGTRGIGINAASYNNVISDNIIENITGISSIGISVAGGSNNNTIKGNRVKTCAIGISPSQKGCIIEGNLVENCTSSGISMFSGENNIIIGNISRNNGLYGIYLDANSKYNTVIGNQAYDDQGSPTQDRGIYLDGPDNIVANNFMWGNTVAQLAYANCEVPGNRLSKTDRLVVSVTLNDAIGTQTITNSNIGVGSRIQIIPTNAGAADRQWFLQSQTAGSCVLNLVNSGSGDTVKLFIS